MSRPGWNVHEDSCGWIFEKIPGIDHVHRRELLDRRTIHVALQDSLEGRPRGFKTQLHLFENELGLALDRRVDHLTGHGVEWGEARNIDRIAMPRHRRSRRLPFFQIRGERLHANDLSFHCGLPCSYCSLDG